MSSYTPPIFTAILFILWWSKNIDFFNLAVLASIGARQNTHCPWWAALDSNQAKLNYQFYRLARYLLRYTDPYYLTFGGSSWTQTRTSIRRRIYRNLLKNPAVKVFIKSRKRNRVSPSAVSINSTNDPYLIRLGRSNRKLLFVCLYYNCFASASLKNRIVSLCFKWCPQLPGGPYLRTKFASQ